MRWWLQQLQTPPCDIQKSEKVTPNLGHSFKRGKPSQKPHPAGFPQWPELGHRPIPQSVTVRGTRATAGRTVRTHCWARRESLDSYCTWFLTPEQSYSSVSKNKGWGRGFRCRFGRQSNNIYSSSRSSGAPNNLNYIPGQKGMRKPSH